MTERFVNNNGLDVAVRGRLSVLFRALQESQAAPNPLVDVADALEQANRLRNARSAAEYMLHVARFNAIPGFTPEEDAYIKLYTAEKETVPNLYSEMNRQAYNPDRRMFTDFVPYAWGLLHALDKIEPYKGTTVLRGVKMVLPTSYTVGRQLIWWGMTSCTKDMMVLERPEFCGQAGDRIVFVITLTQNAAREVTQFSMVASECEILLPFGSTFEVTGIGNMGSGLMMVQLLEVEPADMIFDIRRGGSLHVEQTVPEPGDNVTSNNARVDAAVERGPDWRWADQDGGAGCRGRITELRADWVVVSWDAGTKNSYRVGHDDNYDLRHLGAVAVALAEEELRSVLSQPGARLLPKHLSRTFGYPSGVRSSYHDRFDIRDAVCQAVGGFRHGQVVKTMITGTRAVTIGVKPDDGIAKLWFHASGVGATGAGLFDATEPLEACGGRQKVAEARPEHETDNETMLRLADSLQLTFPYNRGKFGTALSMFDVRDEVCLAVGGFKHGQVLQLPRYNKMVVVGVSIDDGDGLPLLWFHIDGDQGASTFARKEYTKVRSLIRTVEQRQLIPAPAPDENEVENHKAMLRDLAGSVDPFFGYPVGTGRGVRHGLFDISDTICQTVSGFKHGQVVLQPDGTTSVAVGVRLEADGEDYLPVMFFHVDGAPGAGMYQNYASMRSTLVAAGTRELRYYQHNDPIFTSGSAGAADDLQDDFAEVALNLGRLKQTYKNSQAEGLKTCLSTLKVYITNWRDNPQEAKFNTLKLDGKTFSTKVAPFDGAIKLLVLLGFERKMVHGEDVLQQRSSAPDGRLCGHALEHIDLILKQL